MSESVDILRRRFREFEDASEWTDDEISDAISDASLDVDPQTYGKSYQKAVLALAAHFLKVAKRSEERATMAAPGDPGVILDTHGGGQVSYTYKTPDPDADDEAVLRSTEYGQEFLRIKGQIVVGPVFASPE